MQPSTYAHLHGRRPRRRGRRKPPRALYPRSLEREYCRSLLSLLKAAHGLVEARLLPELPRLQAEAAAVFDSSAVRLDDYASTTARLFDDIRVEYEQTITETHFEDVAAKAAGQVSTFNRVQVTRQFQSLLSVDVLAYEPWLEPLAKGFVRENVALIKSLETKHFDDIERRVLQTFRSGKRAESLSRQLKEQYGATQKRAMLIARDQIGKLNGNLTRQRQKALGVERYIWRTSKDERVRSLHLKRENTEFSWDDPPEDGHPGEAIQCRCTADPVIEV